MTDESIFAAAMALKTEAERQAYLDQVCKDNPALRAEVEALLKAEAGAGSFLNHPAVGTEATIAMGAEHDTVESGAGPVSLTFLKPCDSPGRIGRLEHYEVIEVVGQGGMGVVLRAFDTKLSRIVAVKVMAPELAANPQAVKRFLREAKTAAAVHHDHVVTIHAVGDHHQPPYLVMQFVEGQTLQQKIDREGALELKTILRIGSQTAAGLAAAHKHGLIHRDVKPANILLENGVERVKITDFGLARAADDMEMTQTGIIAGTPQYMSPEQAKGEPVDSRSDLFSLGSVLYTMCAGRPGFRAETTMGVLKRVCEDAPRPIREVNPEIPTWLEAIVLRLLAKNPADRFGSAAEVSDLLGQHLAHEQNPSQVMRPTTVVLPPAELQPGKEVILAFERRCLRVAGIVSIAAFVISVFCLTFRLDEINRNWPAPIAIWFLMGGLLSLPQGMAILYGASRQSLRWTLAAAILALAPTNIYLLVSLPITIWTLVTLRRLGKAQPPPKPAKPDHLTREQRHRRSLAMATLLMGAFALTLVVVVVLVKEVMLPVTTITIVTDDPEVIVTIDDRLSPTSTLSGQHNPNIPQGGPNWVGFWVTHVRPGTHRVRALKGTQVVYDETFELKRGEQRPIDLKGRTSIVLAGHWLPTAADLFRQPANADGFVPLFNGKDLAGWKPIPGLNWKVEDGVIKGGGPDAFLITETGDFEDFHLLVEFRINAEGDAGVYFRIPTPVANRGGHWGYAITGFEAEIGIQKQPGYRTGALTVKNPGGQVLVPSKLPPHAANEWMRLEVLALKEHIQILVNGKVAADYLDVERRFPRGHIALASWEDDKINTAVEFRKVQIKKLPDVAPGSSADILTSSDWEWSEPENLGPAVNSRASEASPELSADGLTLIFSRNITGDFQDFDLWMCTRASPSEPWSPATSLGPNVNAKYTSEGQGALSADGLTLLYASDARWEGHQGGRDLWMTTRTSKAAEWSAPVNLGWPVNGPKDESAPALSRDGLTLILESDREGESADLWICTRPALDRTWSQPVRLGPEINSSQTETAPSLSADGLTLLFSSTRVRVREGGFGTWISTRPAIDKPWSPAVRIPQLGNVSTLSADGTSLITSFLRDGGHGLTDLYLLRRVRKQTPAAVADAAAARWTPLFNRQDLTGWTEPSDTPSAWDVVDGVLVGKGVYSYLASDYTKYRDFHLRAEARINEGGNSGLYFRAELLADWKSRGCIGYEAEISSSEPGGKTGSLRTYPQSAVLQKIDEPLVPPGEWFTYDVIAHGDKITTYVNGKPAASVTDKTHAQGRIALQLLAPETTVVEFRKIDIRELAPAPPPAVAPFDAPQAKAYQQAWATHLGVPAQFKNDQGMKFRLVPPGEFQMGTAQDKLEKLIEAVHSSNDPAFLKPLKGEIGPRKVLVREPFYLGTTEVTVGEFRRFVEAANYKTSAEKSGDGGWSGRDGLWTRHKDHVWKTPGEWTLADDQPVVHVSHDDAVAFCEWLSQEEGLNYVLPTRIQWEFAARAGATGLFGASDDPATLAQIGWAKYGLPPGRNNQPQPVGGKAANAFGLFDMVGNVWEWTSTWDAADTSRRIIAGGSWYLEADGTRPAVVGNATPSIAWDAGTGFRVAIVGDLTAAASPPPPPAVAPFDVARAAAHQQAWAEHLGVPVQITNSAHMTLRLIPPGKNAVGPSGQIESAAPFYLSTCEVTVDQFRQFVDAIGHKTTGEASKLGGMRVERGQKTKRRADYVWNHPELAADGACPVTLITWQDAQAFCDWLSREEGRTYRLPTGAEWQWAAQAGSAEAFYFGAAASEMDAHAWHKANSDDRVHPVGTKQANPWGLFDVYGNAWELSYDWERAGQPLMPAAATAGPAGQDRIHFWGGAYSALPEDATQRATGPPSMGYSHLGFRVAIVGDLTAGQMLDRSSMTGQDAAAWRPLFNRQNLTGWKISEGSWKVEGGHLVGGGDQAKLRTERFDFRDFHLRLEAKYVGGYGVLLLRGQQANIGEGYEIYLRDGDENFNTGAILTSGRGVQGDSAHVKQQLTKPGEWFTLDVIARGKHLETFVNGQKVVDFVDSVENNVTAGCLRLSAIGDKAELHVKKLEIIELPAGAAADSPEVAALRDLVAAAVRSRDTMIARFDEGKVPRLDVVAVEVEVAEARIRLAEAQAAPAGAIEQLEVLVKLRTEERALVELLVKTGVATPQQLSAADLKLADAQARLAKAKTANKDPAPG
jgi:formylglycine-generating enzyme required for sulfatase activity/uncharacterized membrane protein